MVIVIECRYHLARSNECSGNESERDADSWNSRDARTVDALLQTFGTDQFRRECLSG